jgi:hypothetical protein
MYVSAISIRQMAGFVPVAVELLALITFIKLALKRS